MNIIRDLSESLGKPISLQNELHRMWNRGALLAERVLDEALWLTFTILAKIWPAPSHREH
ncbi:hypothetical protein EXS71_02950 [Candidatus Uhrbacteria bacterium]|nr:hypothetical protein [Candidatus Uhrbacteria bacterium]